MQSFFVQFISTCNIKNGELSSSQNLHHEHDLGYFLSMRTYDLILLASCDYKVLYVLELIVPSVFVASFI